MMYEELRGTLWSWQTSVPGDHLQLTKKSEDKDQTWLHDKNVRSGIFLLLHVVDRPVYWGDNERARNETSTLRYAMMLTNEGEIRWCWFKPGLCFGSGFKRIC